MRYQNRFPTPVKVLHRVAGEKHFIKYRKRKSDRLCLNYVHRDL